MAENGAVLEFPATGYSAALAVPPPGAWSTRFPARRHRPRTGTRDPGCASSACTTAVGAHPPPRAPVDAGLQQGPRDGFTPGGEQGDRPQTGADHSAPVAAERGRDWRRRKRPRAATGVRGRVAVRRAALLSNPAPTTSSRGRALRPWPTYAHSGRAEGYRRQSRRAGVSAGTRRRRHAAVACGTGSQRARRGRPENRANDESPGPR